MVSLIGRYSSSLAGLKEACVSWHSALLPFDCIRKVTEYQLYHAH